MRESTLEPTPRSRVEKVYDSNVVTYLSVILVLLVVVPSLEGRVGYWPALGISIALGFVVASVLTLPAIRLKKRRVALDAQQGIFECAHRERGSALKGRWAQGYARAEPGRLLFQAKTGVTGPLAGPVEIYSHPTPIGEPTKAPWAASPRGRVITLDTDKGEVELAATPADLVLLAERCLGKTS